MIENHKQLVSTARITGIWYLLLAISGILGFLVFHSQVFVTNDPEQTLTNLAESVNLARVRLLFEILIVLSQALAALWFYKLFRSISDWEAWAVGVWGTVNSVVIMISAIAMASAIHIATNSVAAHEDKILLTELLVNLISHSWAVGGLFFGLWLIPMGHMVITSRRMPAGLGWTLLIGGVGYILKTVIYYLGIKHSLLDLLTIPATVGEFWMIGYLLVFGIRPEEKQP